MIDQLNGSRRFALPQDQPLANQGSQVTHHAVGRLDLESVANFADGWPIAARFDFLFDEVVNLALPLRQCAQVRHDSPPEMRLPNRSVSGRSTRLVFALLLFLNRVRFHVYLSILDARTQKKRIFWFCSGLCVWSSEEAIRPRETS